MRFSYHCLLSLLLTTGSASAFITSPAGRSATFLNANTVTRKPNSAVEIAITAPGTATSAAFDKACSELSKNVTIAGFRKGAKIPPKVLEGALAARGGRSAIRAQAINALVAELVEPALKSEGVTPIGQPTLIVSAEELAETFEPGKDIEIKVACDVWPAIKFTSEEAYKGLKGSYTRKPFNQEKFDTAMADLRDRYAETSKIDDPTAKLAMGDACVVNMVGYMATADGEKGEPLPNAASGDNVEIILGQGRYMEGLVEGLIGASVGDTKTVTVAFPDKLRDKSLAGKKAVFDVNVLETSTRSLPELNDEFAEKVRPGLTIESLKEELRKAIDEEDSKEYVGARNKALADALAEVLDVEVPETIVQQQAKEKYTLMMTEMRDGGTSDAEIKKLITPENFQKYRDIVADDIKKDFKISMASDYLGEIEQIEVPANQIDEQMGALKKEAESVGEAFEEAAIRPKVEATLQRRLVFDFLAGHADLEVIYSDEKEPEFDAALMEKLGEESLKREQDVESGEPIAMDVEEDSSVGSTEIKSMAEDAEAPADEVEQEVVEAAEEVEAEEAPPATEAPKSPEDGAALTAKYASMSEEERAFAILSDLGMIKISPDPDDPNYNPSIDDDFCPEYDAC
uniref:peptidylprolyl isomerase n=1 Tax=Leptocylindrus danicus TaxID=163516 RepID=A0A7S2LBQ1_9STRA|mmetsp:Transcript_34539/g.50134  ORF Transcript_34539/g.50134 Transcript_34539/m.50134 type:complete len:629 (+) Transcript_34539:72-1958(+)